MFEFKLYYPSALLQKYVQYYVVTTISELKNELAVQEILPMALSGIHFMNIPGIVHFNHSEKEFDPAPLISMIGQLTTKRLNKFLLQGNIITAIFSSFGLFKIWGIQMSHMSNTVCNALDILNAAGLKSCWEQMFETLSSEQSIRILENFLLSNLEKNDFELRKMDKIVDCINASKGNINIDWLAHESNMSLKTFERHFSEKIGLPPKVFTRIIRFSNAMKMLQMKKGTFEILEVCGYTDQSHLIKDFKAFTGKSPRQYYPGLQEMLSFFMEHSIKE
ncbi:AraC-like DNA-binding protein [Chitinophaga dinghuensis]|uniref:AraC-like DNA-binding protein n=1 Tax=Chitinophaga dinghuensis TaxID=1539050 RepID=A0A327VX72_9BACT|nr:helix-turn-helix domain-containing protein [Chitinophaga dinghuensis]RAJ80082.1 AraC-like DNA-binding protein [Chitinophaga dinghuensis]